MANFAQIPSWFSLRCSPPSLKTQQNPKQGHVENLHLVSLAKQGKIHEAREFLKEMDTAGLPLNPHTYKCLFETCGELNSLWDGRFFHDRLRRTVEKPSGNLENSVLKMYCRCGSLVDARRVFDEMLDKNLVSWIIIISAYAQEGLLDRALGLLSHMRPSGITPNSSIYITLLSSLRSPSLLEIGKQIHSYSIRNGIGNDVSVHAAIVNMYVKCGWLEGAGVIFDKMVEKNAVGWTGLMFGYVEAGRLEDALILFAKTMSEGVELDEYVFSIALKACANMEDLNLGRQIHGYIIKVGLESEVSVGTPLVDLYVKCASFESACRAFESICEPNDVSWSALITGYCQAGKFGEAIKAFGSLRSKCFHLNPFIYTSIFQACSATADFNMGAQAHADAIKRGLVSYLHGESAMITMYSKCGMLDYAYQAFESIDKPDTVAWTAIISGHAYHGNASEALRLFKRMQDQRVRPNAVTFVALLTACSHSGLVKEGKRFLESMGNDYGIVPTIDHYDCMIDIYSRAGLLQKALELVESMPCEPDAMSWKSLLGGCWIHRNYVLGTIAAEKLLQLDPYDIAAYILMFNLYASTGKWEEAAFVRKMMSQRNLKKELGCSWITVKGKVHRFIVGDKHHPQTKEIYSKLKQFSPITNNEIGLHTKEDESGNLPERKEQLLDHSERLAIAFGLISMPCNGPIVIFKNLRACKDCHDFAKQVSETTGRKIVVRDSCRFHHFESGKCSCNDYW
ncbi:pentatricopeptide repeat-containing protein [Tripterygium wilfordii]|uniref:Pentatricopeptide repeat-containing protein n=1 Tax=Tripterygium wilfordii TaxID=458696 RepID=A0A7J7D4E5_TRIWF|nr:pentatricopeptide repeat-containing protein At5g13270, chloroplastic [Tripterygium wilfordii]KAF5741210.1 pentatricopeptide repeat-containing protein [Tripterygium wilfordii]